MQERKDWKMWMGEKTPITTQHSGLNLGESQQRIEKILAELNDLLKNDPYWRQCVGLYGLLTRKRNYYNCTEDPLANAKAVKEVGIKPWTYQLARIGEKYRRLSGQLKTIDIKKTLMDVAGHAIIGVVLLNEEPDS
jgi:hypothetical protein